MAGSRPCVQRLRPGARRVPGGAGPGVRHPAPSAHCARVDGGRRDRRGDSDPPARGPRPRPARSVPGPLVRVGPFRLESWTLPHYVPNAGVRLSTSGLTVAYTGDTGPDPALADLGRGGDLYVMEATDRDQQISVPAARTWSAYAPGRAGRRSTAAAAGARRLPLSHFWPGNDRQAARAAAAAVFSGGSSSPMKACRYDCPEAAGWPSQGAALVAGGERTIGRRPVLRPRAGPGALAGDALVG